MPQSTDDPVVDVTDVDALVDEPHAEVFDARDPRTVRLSLEAGERVPAHQHPESMVVLYVLTGEIALSLGGDEYDLSEGDAVRFDGAQDVSPEAVTDAEAFLVFTSKTGE
ncbi:MAG: cupin domain-containing protein [Halobacterium sp.]